MRKTVRLPLAYLPPPSRPGQMVAFDVLRPLPKTERGKAYVLLLVGIFSRHAEGCAMQNS